MSSEEARHSVLLALEYVNDLGDKFSSPDKKDAKPLARKIMKDMRSSLPVPAIFVCLKILHRLQTFAQKTSKAFEEDEGIPALTPSQNHVDFTIKQIWRRWLAKLQKRASQRSDWEDCQWNYYEAISSTLRTVVDYNTNRYFDISFYDA